MFNSYVSYVFCKRRGAWHGHMRQPLGLSKAQGCMTPCAAAVGRMQILQFVVYFWVLILLKSVLKLVCSLLLVPHCSDSRAVKCINMFEYPHPLSKLLGWDSRLFNGIVFNTPQGKNNITTNTQQSTKYTTMDSIKS